MNHRVADATVWTTEALKDHLHTVIDGNDRRYEQQFGDVRLHVHGILDANDRRYEQRFKDSQTAVDAALNAAKTAVGAALDAAKEAVAKAEVAVEKRLESVNEFRGALDDRQRTLMPRTEAEIRFAALEAQLEKQQTLYVERRGTQTGGREVWGFVVGGVGVLLGIMGFAVQFLP